MSRRAEAKKQRKHRGRFITLAAVGGLALAGVAALIALNRPSPAVVGGEAVVIDADGTAWGPKDAPVRIEEYSDFQ